MTDGNNEDLKTRLGLAASKSPCAPRPYGWPANSRMIRSVSPVSSSSKRWIRSFGAWFGWCGRASAARRRCGRSCRGRRHFGTAARAAALTARRTALRVSFQTQRRIHLVMAASAVRHRDNSFAVASPASTCRCAGNWVLNHVRCVFTGTRVFFAISAASLPHRPAPVVISRACML